jgi:hypothetical protein
MSIQPPASADQAIRTGECQAAPSFPSVREAWAALTPLHGFDNFAASGMGFPLVEHDRTALSDRRADRMEPMTPTGRIGARWESVRNFPRISRSYPAHNANPAIVFALTARSSRMLYLIVFLGAGMTA